MKNTANYAVFLMLFAFVTVLTIVGIAQTRQQESQGDKYEKEIALRNALRNGGIRAAAELERNYVGIFDPNPDWLKFNVEKLTKNSQAVIIGVPSRNRGKLSKNAEFLYTLYDVKVQEVLKGNIAAGNTIKVALPGGKVSFADGTTAEIRTPGFRKMLNGRTYALYLSESSEGDDIYFLTAGPQGLLELISKDKKVYSHAADGSPIKEQVKDENLDEFLKEARKQARDYPSPIKCCN